MRRRKNSGSIKITRKGVITGIFVLLATVAVAIGLTYTILDGNEQRITRYNRALRLTDENQIVQAMNTNAGLAFISGTIGKVSVGATITDLNGTYAYIRMIREEYRRDSMDEDEWDWEEVDSITVYANSVRFGKLELSASAFNTQERLTLSREIMNREGGRIVEGKYHEFDGGLFGYDYRFSYQVIEFDKTYSALVDFNGEPLSNVRLYRKTVDELHAMMTSTSPIGTFFGMWLMCILISIFVIVIIYSIKNSTKNKVRKRQVIDTHYRNK
jgi:hypothetical protein